MVAETGLYNLTNDEVPVLVHFGPDRQEPADPDPAGRGRGQRNGQTHPRGDESRANLGGAIRRNLIRG